MLTVSMKVTSIVILLIFLLSSCTDEKLEIEYSEDPNKVIAQISDNSSGLKQIKTVSGIDFELIRLTSDIIVSKELAKGIIKNSEIPQRMSDLEKTQGFYFKISSGNSNQFLTTSKFNAQELFEYLSFEMQRDFLIKSEDGIQDCKIYEFVNSHGLKAGLEFIIEFEKPEGGHYTLEYNDILFGLGKINFKIDTEKGKLIKLKY